MLLNFNALFSVSYNKRFVMIVSGQVYLLFLPNITGISKNQVPGTCLNFSPKLFSFT